MRRREERWTEEGGAERWCAGCEAWHPLDRAHWKVVRNRTGGPLPYLECRARIDFRRPTVPRDPLDPRPRPPSRTAPPVPERGEDDETERSCRTCGEAWLDSPEFWPTIKGRLGSECRACHRERHNARSRARRAADPEKYRAREREAYWRSPEASRARSRRAWHRRQGRLGL